jgi:UDP-N-acetylmuramoyl-tripeptide--D-alanyl-D-alanine ligase
VRIIDDSYNASPDSMASAIDYLASFTEGRRIAVLAGMNELGERTVQLHRSVGAYAAGRGVDMLVAVGEAAAGIAEGFGRASKTVRFAGNAEAAAWLAGAVRDGDAVLVKGSRSYRTEEIVEALAGGSAQEGVPGQGPAGEAGEAVA